MVEKQKLFFRGRCSNGIEYKQFKVDNTLNKISHEITPNNEKNRLILNELKVLKHTYLVSFFLLNTISDKLNTDV